MMEGQHRLDLSDLNDSKNKLLASSSFTSSKNMIMGLVVKAGVVCVVELLKMLKSYCEKRRQRKEMKLRINETDSGSSNSLIVQRRKAPSRLNNKDAQPQQQLTTSKNTQVVLIRGYKSPSGKSIVKSSSFNGFPSRKKYVNRRRRRSFPSSSLCTLIEENEDVS